MQKLRTINILSLVIACLLLSGCYESLPDNTTFQEVFEKKRIKPRSMRKDMYGGFPMGDDSYSVGFRDGCDTFSGVMGGAMMRLLPTKIDADRLSKDRWYVRGFQDGSTFCTFRIDWEVH